MELFVSELESRMEAALKEIDGCHEKLICYDRSVSEIHTCIRELKAWLETHPFPGKFEEIRYHKEFAPRIYSRLFYFMKLYQVESNRKYAGREKMRDVLLQELAGIELFYKQHADICRYYAQNVSYWDDHLFTTRGQQEWPIEHPGLHIGAHFTLGCYWAAWILVNDPYERWLQLNLISLDFEANLAGVAERRSYLRWRGSNADLLEVLYGMHLNGSFGKATFKEIVEVCGQAFGVDLRNYNTVVQQIAQRKKDPTQYIHSMERQWVKAIDDRTG